ncbi:hypothetical protein BAUCODRAFT_157996 [Baudoinia panamericana UAMH 10762]|uniref:PHD-type domain-containing protein n=1 Tax=Baudoinia panamericana (strain UAMH 10762) TaxID=717646 RepID=M2MSA3_BAUPA|nr:uncharacterized protein BAUCODRAFT_157996 [Baudoinia panamericana UAMH 10762]EMC94383.1 hypothetical protein BAUCODRAFT_157996 [Baudoinia panamericana UAMH 10762]
MAATIAIAPRPPARTPARSPRARSYTGVSSEPPHKKRKYIAGGPGGGGRWVDAEGNEITDPALIPPPVRSVPRSRSARQRSEAAGEAPREDGEEAPAPPRSTALTRPQREREPTRRYAPQPTTPRPRYSNAAAAAAASQASDGYKPREERSWEDFHPELDIEAKLFLFTADEVDGRTPRHDFKQPLLHSASTLGEEKPVINGDIDMRDAAAETEELLPLALTPSRRKPGRPPRRPESMLTGLGSPPAPRIVPLPTHNPKERLNLPKPSFKQYNHFLQYEEDARENKVNYVDRSMSHIGYQETDRYELPPKVLIRLSEAQQVEDEAEVSLRLESDGPAEVPQTAPVVGRVEYDMDEQDVAWLDELNEQRRTEGVDAIKPAIFEITMTQIEKEYHALEKRIPKPQPRHAQTHRPRSSSQAAVNGDPNPPGDEPDSKCSICDDGDCENANAIIFCDGCDLAVHQECYGVPFIPEGQWFCRKCKEIGRGTPTCIFCPNVDGAFKQTNTLRWSHLLCAIWIPEVTIANMTFMEPITDVDKVPKGRWKLNCYICNQRMGACIQCGNKNCYLAFHVTCARRAKLFLKMKSQHQGGIDTTALKAFCDKHVPPDWRRLHDTDHAIIEAKRWYRHAFRDRKWADSQTAALELGAPAPPDGGLVGADDSSNMIAGDTIAVTKRRRTLAPAKMSWRLPSGAPVVPAVVFNTVDASLTRFTIRKRKEFVEKCCRYWTLKREARRGAALLKRLQLQLEGFSTMEVTRRNFVGMGAIGRVRLVRRIEFAGMLQQEMGRLGELTGLVRRREGERLREVEVLRELIDTVYFPISAMLGPILQKAFKLDEKTRTFTPGFDAIALRLRERHYTSVQDFSRDFSVVISKVLLAYPHPTATTSSAADDHQHEAAVDVDGVHTGASGGAGEDIETIHNHLHEIKPGTAEHHALSQEQKEVKKLAKRIVKAVKEALEDALKKEAELKGHEHLDALRKLDEMGIFASAKNGGDVGVGERKEDEEVEAEAATAGASPDDLDRERVWREDVEMVDAADVGLVEEGDTAAVPLRKTTPASRASSGHGGHAVTKTTTTSGMPKPTEPLSPPISTDLPSANRQTEHEETTYATDAFAQGGVPWYLEPFDPVGTTIHEERYMGRAVLRDMSEELSDMDEDTLTELAPGNGEMTPTANDGGGGKAAVTATPAKGGAKKASAKKKGKGRRYR